MELDMNNINQFLDMLIMADNTISATMNNIAVFLAAITLVFAAIYCFFGYKLFRIMMGIIGFLVFGMIGSAAGYGMSQETGVAIIVGLVTGVLGAFIMYYLYLVGVFILIGFSGFIIGAILVENIGASVVIGIIVGAIGVFFAKPAIIISTSISGGLLMGNSLGIILEVGKAPSLLFGLLFVGLGIYIQFKTNSSVSGSPRPISANANQSDIITDETTNLTAKITNDVATAKAEMATTKDEMLAMIDVSAVKKASTNLKAKILEKIQIENQIVKSEVNRTAKKDSLEYNFENIELMLFKNSFAAIIMPFIQYILLFFAFLAMFTSISSTLVLVALAGLTLIRRKYEHVIVAMSVLFIIRMKSLILFLKYAKISMNIGLLITILFELILVAGIIFIAVKYYLNLERGQRLKQKTLEYYNQLKDKTAKKTCDTCNETVSVNAKFCNNCGAQIDN